jgi:4-hydroxy-2-oxoheptanedioate aldolase
MLGGITNLNDYLAIANDAVLTFAMIETGAALKNVDAIAATPGIDGLFLGPSDLSIALSQGRTLDPLSPEVESELDSIIAAARRAGKIAGAYCHDARRAVDLAKRGVRFLAVASDMAFLRAGAAAQIKVIEGG